MSDTPLQPLDIGVTTSAPGTQPSAFLVLRRRSTQVRTDGTRLSLSTPNITEFKARGDRVINRTVQRDLRLRPDVVYKATTGLLPVGSPDFQTTMLRDWRSTPEAWQAGVQVLRVDLEDGELVIFFSVMDAIPVTSIPQWFEHLGTKVDVVLADADKQLPDLRILGDRALPERVMSSPKEALKSNSPDAPAAAMTEAQREAAGRAFLRG